MQQDTENLHIVVIVTREEMIEDVSRLCRSAGINVRSDEPIDEIIACLQYHPAVLLHLPDGDSDRSALDNLIVTARNNHQATSCFIVSQKKISQISEDFMKFIRQSSKKRARRKTLSEIERDHIIDTLDSTNWHYKTAARVLGINRTTLYRKLKKYGLRKDFK